MTAKSVTVVNQLGMHARAAAKFVHLAAKYESHIRVARDAREMDGKSIMGLLLLAAALGAAYLPAQRATRVNPAEALRTTE